MCVFNFLHVDLDHCHKYFVFSLHNNQSDYIIMSIMAISLILEYNAAQYGYNQRLLCMFQLFKYCLAL